MISTKSPRISIGLPVYNGENFVGEAIRSFLAQTFEDFELLISDNASTDGTEHICREFAALDKRTKYVRNAENIGLTRNFNQVFALSSGEYFKWADHDDLCHPDFLMRCARALDDDPEIVLAYSRAQTIDGNGRVIKQWEPRPELSSPQVSLRFRRALKREEPFPQSGLIRGNVLKRTRLLGVHVQSDIVLLAELSLLGRFAEIPEFLFMVREHPQRCTRTHDWQVSQSMPEWMDPTAKKSITLLEWGLLVRLTSAVHRAGLTWPARWRCYGELYEWGKSRRGALVYELVFAVQRIPVLGTVSGHVYSKYKTAVWNHRLRRSSKDVAVVIPPNETIILVDEAKFPPDVFADRRTVPFLERNGQYWGVPPNDETAIRDLERLRQFGATFMVFAWPTFWWLEFYSGFNRYLRARFRCVMETAHLVIFDLRHEPASTPSQGACVQMSSRQSSAPRRT